MVDKTGFIDARELKPRDVLLLIIRKPYNEEIVILTKKDDAHRFVARLRTTLTRVKERVVNAGKTTKPLTICVISVEAFENGDKLVLCTQKTRSSIGDPLGDLVSELGEMISTEAV